MFKKKLTPLKTSRQYPLTDTLVIFKLFKVHPFINVHCPHVTRLCTCVNFYPAHINLYAGHNSLAIIELWNSILFCAQANGNWIREQKTFCKMLENKYFKPLQEKVNGIVLQLLEFISGVSLYSVIRIIFLMEKRCSVLQS